MATRSVERGSGGNNGWRQSFLKPGERLPWLEWQFPVLCENYDVANYREVKLSVDLSGFSNEQKEILCNRLIDNSGLE
jgi:hypothetical protein